MIESCIEYSSGRVSWETACQEIAERQQRLFGARLRRAQWMQRLIFKYRGGSLMAWLVSHCTLVWKAGFACTR